MEFDFFSEICQLMSIMNGRCKHVLSSNITLLHQLLECILNNDIYQVGNVKCPKTIKILWLVAMPKITENAGIVQNDVYSTFYNVLVF